MFIDSIGVFTCTLFTNSYQNAFSLFNSRMQFVILEYLYAVFFASNLLSSSPNIMLISLVSYASNSTSISIAIHEFSPSPELLSNAIVSKPRGFFIFWLPINESLFPV